jgi:SOS-response transcriptional repressor LexA
MSDVIRQRIQERLTLLGKNARQVSIEATGKPDTIRDLMRRPKNGMLAHTLAKIANALETSTAYLMGETDDASRSVSSLVGGTGLRRAVPVLDAAGAAAFAEHDPPPYVGGRNTLIPDVEVSARAFAILLGDDSMAPAFQPGDVVVIDPALTPRPGDHVAVRMAHDNEVLFRRYHQRKEQSTGRDYAELAPVNPAWPTLVLDWGNPGEVLGAMVEHRRAFKR